MCMIYYNNYSGLQWDVLYSICVNRLYHQYCVTSSLTSTQHSWAWQSQGQTTVIATVKCRVVSDDEGLDGEDETQGEEDQDYMCVLDCLTGLSDRFLVAVC